MHVHCIWRVERSSACHMSMSPACHIRFHLKILSGPRYGAGLRAWPSSILPRAQTSLAGSGSQQALSCTCIAQIGLPCTCAATKRGPASRLHACEAVARVSCRELDEPVMLSLSKSMCFIRGKLSSLRTFHITEVSSISFAQSAPDSCIADITAHAPGRIVSY